MSRCQYRHRIPLGSEEFVRDTLGIKMGGSIGADRCNKEALPELVYCTEHADKDAMAMVIKMLHKRIKNYERTLQTKTTGRQQQD